MLTIPRSAFKAAVICAATKDVRYYLIGVHIERTAAGPVHIVSTNGSSLFVGAIESPECTQSGPWDLTVPLDVAKAAAKGKGEVQLIARDDGRYELDGRVFAPVDGKFPDWRRVVPTSPTGERADFDHALLADAQLAVATWHGCKPAAAWVKMDGTGPAIVSTAAGGSWGVVMPTRNNTKEEPARPQFAPRGA